MLLLLCINKGCLFVVYLVWLSLEGRVGVKWELEFPLFWVGKWDLLQWDWDSTSGNGMNNFGNENGIFILSAL